MSRLAVVWVGAVLGTMLHSDAGCVAPAHRRVCGCLAPRAKGAILFPHHVDAAASRPAWSSSATKTGRPRGERRRTVSRHLLSEREYTMSSHSGLSRRYLLGITMAVGGLAMMRGLRRVWAQAAGSGPVTLDVRHPDLHTLIAPETPSRALRVAWGLPKGRCGEALLSSSVIFRTSGSCAGAACRRARSSPHMPRACPMA
jgi:hypothetical protein